MTMTTVAVVAALTSVIAMGIIAALFELVISYGGGRRDLVEWTKTVMFGSLGGILVAIVVAVVGLVSAHCA